MWAIRAIPFVLWTSIREPYKHCPSNAVIFRFKSIDLSNKNLNPHLHDNLYTLEI